MSLLIDKLQIAYIFLRTADVTVVIQSFYHVIALVGRALQFVVLIVFRKHIIKLLADIQRFVNLSNANGSLVALSLSVACIFTLQKMPAVPFTALPMKKLHSSARFMSASQS